jgi:GntR family transcriptional regulator
VIIAINTQSSTTICEQLQEQIILGIAAKKLLPGESLPSARSLAADLGINYHTVNKAYSGLCDEGYLVIDRRKGAMVAQSVSVGENFSTRLSHTLLVASAECACRGMSEDEFVKLCSNHYKKAEGGML